MSRKKTVFLRKLLGDNIDKILPLKHAKGNGTYLSQVQENRNGRILGAGNTCSRPASPDTEARMRRWAKVK